MCAWLFLHLIPKVLHKSEAGVSGQQGKPSGFSAEQKRLEERLTCGINWEDVDSWCLRNRQCYRKDEEDEGRRNPGSCLSHFKPSSPASKPSQSSEFLKKDATSYPTLEKSISHQTENTHSISVRPGSRLRGEVLRGGQWRWRQSAGGLTNTTVTEPREGPDALRPEESELTLYIHCTTCSSTAVHVHTCTSVCAVFCVLLKHLKIDVSHKLSKKQSKYPQSVVSFKQETIRVVFFYNCSKFFFSIVYHIIVTEM